MLTKLYYGATTMVYKCIIYYANDSFACKAINFIGDQFEHNPRLKLKAESVVIPIGDDDALDIRLIRGIHQPIQRDNPNYVIIERKLITEETDKYLDEEAGPGFKDMWVFSEMELDSYE